MKAKPIIFSGPMVRALLDGRKTQTRRVLSRARVFATPERPAFTLTGADMARALQNADRFRRIDGDGWFWEADAYEWQAPNTRTGWMAHIGYAPGDLLYVRESWAARLDEDHIKASDLTRKEAFFWADGPGRCCNTGCNGAAGRVRAAFHLPRRLSRLTLEVTDVRVQRVQEISEEDARAEGVGPLTNPLGRPDLTWVGTPEVCKAPSRAFRELWDSLNAKRGFGWDANPWVVALTFRVHRCNIDCMEPPE